MFRGTTSATAHRARSVVPILAGEIELRPNVSNKKTRMEALVRPASICVIEGIRKDLAAEHRGQARDQNCAFSPHSIVRGAPKANTPVPAPILSGRPELTVPLIDPGPPLS